MSIHHLYSDNGTEYLALKDILALDGITWLTTPPHTPQHNGCSERRHHHIVETGLSLLHHASMPILYWSLAFSTAVYLINRMLTPILKSIFPFTKLFFTQPNYTKLKSFGCLCFPWLRPYTSQKLDAKSIACVFVGYSSSQSAYYFLGPKMNKIYIFTTYSVH